MTKTKIIGLVVGILVIAGLVGAMIFISSLDDLPEDPGPDIGIDDPHVNENNVIYSCDVAEIDYVNVENSYGNYTVRRKNDGTVYIEGRENAPLFTYSSAALFESAKKVTGTLKIEGGTDTLAAYGLEDPLATVSIGLKNGDGAVFHIGAQEPTATGYYICMDGSRDVYLVSNFYAERYLNDPVELYDTVISEYFAYGEFESLHIDYPQGKDDIFIRTTNEAESTLMQFITGFAMDVPFYFAADSDTMEVIIEILCELEAEKVITDVKNENTLAEYGFDNAVTVTLKANVDTLSPTLETGLANPFYQATMDGSPYPLTATYQIGGTSDRDLYVIYNDAPVIYAVDVDKFAFIEYPLYQYCQKLVSIEYITNLSDLRVEFEGEDYFFSVTDPDAGEDMTVQCDGEYLDQDLFRSFYKTIISVTHNGIEDQPDTEPLMRITYGLINGEELVLEFLPCEDSDRKVFISVNGEGHFVCYKTKVDKIKSDLEKLFNGEEIID